MTLELDDGRIFEKVIRQLPWKSSVLSSPLSNFDYPDPDKDPGRERAPQVGIICTFAQYIITV
jgi:hypothetical protein